MGQAAKTKNTMSKRVIAIIITTIAVIAIAVGVALAVRQHHETSQLTDAKSVCAQAADRLRVAQNKYNALINGDEYKAAVKITTKQVEDGKVVTALAKDSGDKTPAMVACNVEDKTTLEHNTGVIDKNTAWYETHTKTIDTDMKNVVKARDAKTVKDTQAALMKKTADAKKLYDSSKGKVQDGKTRDALKKQMDAADKLKDDKDVKKLKDTQAALDKAMKQVNDSVKAKTAADKKTAEEKARKEAEAQAAAAAAAQAQAQREYVAPQQSYIPTYTAPQQPYTPTYTAPATPQYTAPQQSTPQYTAPAAPAQPAAPSNPNTGSGPISGGHGCNEGDCSSAPYLGYIPR